ncbi:hypothetical protein POM88_005431 [Heracleum sosnowskyi]|uniref:Uncharacterized protein n=1 Tax=Heracleum sosnowskyi TaxID=360622 RepID=A0AAD8N5H8_9APIA|nr:hypothetical protein POM88_005431 [Heracleum sosnowskyi]
MSLILGSPDGMGGGGSIAMSGGKLSLLSKPFRSAAKSNHVWERFLPIDVISRRAVPDQERYYDPWENIDSDTLHAFPTKKDLYLFLCDNPLYIDNGAMQYTWLDKLSGNKCFHIGPMSLTLGHPDGWTQTEIYIGRSLYWVYILHLVSEQGFVVPPPGGGEAAAGGGGAE